jgi:TctA family transporter
VALGLVGTDVQTGQQRFTFGIPELSDGISFVALAMGVFGIAEIILNLERPEAREVLKTKVEGLLLSKEEWKRAIPSVLRGTVLGSALGILPGGGASLAAFGAYMMERKVSKGRNQFGNGAIEGVAGPEAANNAAAQTSFIPLLTLGIPANAVMALMVGALIIQGIQPGPRMVEAQPDLFWGLIASMWIGNVMLVILNLPLVGLWVKLLKIPYRMLYPAILLFCCIGVYASQFSTYDLYLAAGFGLAGYVFRKLECEPAPMVLGFVLGPLMEANFRRAMVLSQGDYLTFVREPISLGFLLLAAVLFIGASIPLVRKRRDAVIAEET